MNEEEKKAKAWDVHNHGTRVLTISIPLDIAGAESALDLTVVEEALASALDKARSMGRAPAADPRDDRELRDAQGRWIGWIAVRREG